MPTRCYLVCWLILSVLAVADSRLAPVRVASSGWDADLRLTEDTGPLTENAWNGLDSLTRGMVWEQPVQEACRAAFRGEFWHDSLLAISQLVLEPVLPELRRLLSLPRCESPQVLDLWRPTPDYVRVFKLNRLLCARPLWQGQLARPDSALAAFQEAWDYACFLEEGSNNLQGFLIGIIMQQDVLRVGWRLLEDESLSPAHCLALSRALAGPEPLQASAARLLRASYTCYARQLDSLALEGQLPFPEQLRTRGLLRPWAARRAFRPDVTLRAYAELTRLALVELPLPYNRVTVPGRVLNDLRQRLPVDSLSGWWGPPNVQGLRFLEQRLSHTALGLTPRTRSWLLLNLRALRLAGALEARRRAEGAWPKELTQLTSLTSLPTDPVTGGPLRWDRERGLLYSVGVDGGDEGGSDEVSEQPLVSSYPLELQRRDLVFHLRPGPHGLLGPLPVPGPPAR